MQWWFAHCGKFQKLFNDQGKILSNLGYPTSFPRNQEQQCRNCYIRLLRWIFFSETLHDNLPIVQAKQPGRSMKKTTSYKRATESPTRRPRWLGRKIFFCPISEMEFNHFWNWFGKSKFPGALISSWSKLLPKTIALSQLEATGFPRMIWKQTWWLNDKDDYWTWFSQNIIPCNLIFCRSIPSAFSCNKQCACYWNKTIFYSPLPIMMLITNNLWPTLITSS